jgi:hypothetical protein
MTIDTSAEAFNPKFEDGEEVLTFYRGKWTHVKWSEVHMRWHLGHGCPFLVNLPDRVFAPLPPKPENADGFYDWRGRP